MAEKKAGADAGAPRWTYAVGAFVAIVSVVWGIVSFFLSDRGSKGAAATMTVSGPASVGVGTMSGGSISVGTTGAALKAVPSEPPRTSK